MSWVFGPGGGTTTTPGGADKDIQFNNNGSFSGSALLTTDGSGSLSASVNITASAFYGDGSNLTGLTASAVNVADGPEYSIQFRRDAPVTGEISGSANIRTNAALDHIFLTGTLYVQGQNAYFGNGSGGGYIRVNGDSDTHIRFGPAGSDSMDLVAGGKRLIRLDENGADVLALGSAATDTIYVSGSLTASVGMIVSASVANGQDIFVGSGTSRTIGTLIDGSDDFFVMGHDNGAVTLSASSGVEFIGGSEGVGSFGSDIKVYATQAGSNTVISLSNSGHISGSGNISGSNFYLTPGKSIFFNGNTETAKIVNNGNNLDLNSPGNIILNSDTILGASSTDVIHASGSLTASVGMRVSASVANGQDIFVGSGTDRTIGVLVDGSDDFFVMGHDAGAVTLSASNGVEFVGNPSGPGVGVFGCPVAVYSDQGGTTSVIKLEKSGDISGSGNFTAKGQITIGVSDEKTANFNIRDTRTFIVNTKASAVTGTLPGVTSHANLGLTYTIKDIAGSGSTNNVVIAASGSQKIDGAAQAKIQTDFGAVTVTAFSSSQLGYGWGITSTT